MKLLFKQRFLSWFDSYNIYRLPEVVDPDAFDYSDGDIEYTVEGQLAWGHCFHITDRNGQLLGVLKQRVFTFFPEFEVYVGGQLIGRIVKEFSFFKPSFSIDFRGWTMKGDFFEWDYSICDASGKTVAAISKQLFNWTDTYVIDVTDDRDALCALMVVLAIDAEKCSRN